MLAVEICLLQRPSSASNGFHAQGREASIVKATQKWTTNASLRESR
jgi:hypothetical protein